MSAYACIPAVTSADVTSASVRSDLEALMKEFFASVSFGEGGGY